MGIMFKVIKRKFASLLFWLNRYAYLAVLTTHTLYLECSRSLKRAFRPGKEKPAIKLISIIVPVPGEGVLPKAREKYYFNGTKQLLTNYLARQTYTKFEVLVYCDGPNSKVKELVQGLGDCRIRYYALAKSTGLYGHPQTREGIAAAHGDYCVRMNCDNRPYPDYLDTLVNGFEGDIGIVYARVVFKGMARKIYRDIFLNKAAYGLANELAAFLLPRDKAGALQISNVSCMNYMIRTDTAKKFMYSWGDQYEADWLFIKELLSQGVKPVFIDAIIGEKR